MSLAKLKKSCRRQIATPSSPLLYKPVILSDSIGAKISQQIYHHTHREIYWWCKGGRTATKAAEWINENLETEVQLINGNLWLYILIGTCDFTSLDKSTRFITLKYQNTSEIVEHLVCKYKEIIKKLKELSLNSQAITNTILLNRCME